jgi:predicted aspartyl protease
MKRHTPASQASKIATVIVTALVGLGSIDPALADPGCKYIKLATLPVEVKDLVPTVQGSINNTSATMLIDSGAPNTMLTQVEKSILGLGGDAKSSDAKNAARKHGKASTANDEKNDTTTAINELSVGPIKLGATHLLTSPSLADHANFGSVMGADFLFQHDMEIALRDKQINFFMPDHCDGKTLSYWDGNAVSVPLETISSNDFRQMVTVEINGQKLRALIDTATPISVIHLSAAAHLGVTPQSPGVTRIVPKDSGVKAAGAGTAATTNAWLAPFAQFSIGDETIQNVKIPIANLRDASSSGNTPDMLLGADFINAHRLLFAVSQRQLYLSYLGGPVFGADAAPNIAQK